MFSAKKQKLSLLKKYVGIQKVSINVPIGDTLKLELVQYFPTGVIPGKYFFLDFFFFFAFILLYRILDKFGKFTFLSDVISLVNRERLVTAELQLRLLRLNLGTPMVDREK